MPAAVKSCNMDGGTDRALDYSQISPEWLPHSHWNAQICIHGRFQLSAPCNPLLWLTGAASSICKGLSRSQLPGPSQVNDLGTHKDPLASQSSIGNTADHKTQVCPVALSLFWG